MRPHSGARLRSLGGKGVEADLEEAKAELAVRRAWKRQEGSLADRSVRIEWRQRGEAGSLACLEIWSRTLAGIAGPIRCRLSSARRAQ
jgi:hypothetical protein